MDYFIIWREKRTKKDAKIKFFSIFDDDNGNCRNNREREREKPTTKTWKIKNKSLLVFCVILNWK